MNIDQFVVELIHFTAHSETLIDVVCSNVCFENVSIHYISDLSTHTSLTCEKKKLNVLITYRPLKNIDRQL